MGAGVVSGDLTPECAAIVGTVLDALSAPAGAEDSRTHAQRYHDALAEAMRYFRNCVVMLVKLASTHLEVRIEGLRTARPRAAIWRCPGGSYGRNTPRRMPVPCPESP